MYLLAYALLLIAFLCSLGGAAWVILMLWQGRNPGHGSASRIPEYMHMVQTVCMVLASVLLLRALIVYDFSVVYVASYTDRLLPLFYRLTGFWAGQAGSLLFWALAVAVIGLIFQLMPRYMRLSEGTRLWYWLFFFVIMAFFGILLTAWSNPFIIYDQAPADGSGLNPLLQNPGMIFHPPLLFLGYGGFVVPGCLALAQCLSRSTRPLAEDDWSDITRPFTITAWLFLTAGIVLGGWWSYMELGWGGYWAWDPVENASLIPWLVATAALHTLIIQSRRHKLYRVNVLLMALTTISAFFATYLVRSGVVQSLHAFGDGGVGMPLLVFILAATGLSLWCALLGKNKEAPSLAGIETREGFLVLTAWLLLCIAMVILVATMWPVFSTAFGGSPMGLEPAFYNRVCLPLFAMLVLILSVCPWLGWNGGIRDLRRLCTIVGVFVASGCALWGLGYHQPVAVFGMGASIAALVSMGLMALEPAVRRHRPSLAAYGVHMGLALMALGIAFSGPYKAEREVVLRAGEQVQVGGFDVTLNSLTEGKADTYAFTAAELAVTRAGKPVGIASPERRIYHKWNRQAFAEAAVIPSAGSEFYASLLAVDGSGRATLRMSSNPLINWVWLGGVLMCVFPLLGLSRRTERESA